MAFIPKNNGPSRRAAAFGLDGLIMAIILIPLSFGIIFLIGLEGINQPEIKQKYQIIVNLISAIPTFFYVAWFYKNKGGTPGKLFFKLQVVNLKTGGRLSYGTSFIRDILGKNLVNILFPMLGGLYLLIDFLFIMFRKKDRRSLHDLIAGTQVIYTGPDEQAGL